MNTPSRADPARGWDRAYVRGDHLRQWDCPWPSPELVGVIVALGHGAIRTALDLGCGTGAEGRFLASRGVRTVGVDISLAALRIAHDRAPVASVNLSWCQADVLRLPLPAASMDFVNDRGCFHHVPTSQRRQYVDEVTRILAPGGYLLLRGMSEEGRHKTPVTPQDVEDAFHRHAFTEIDAVDYTMTGAHGSVPGCLSLLRRR